MKLIKSLVIHQESKLSFHAKLHGKDQEFTDYPCKSAAEIDEKDQIFSDSGGKSITFPCQIIWKRSRVYRLSVQISSKYQ